MNIDNLLDWGGLSLDLAVRATVWLTIVLIAARLAGSRRPLIASGICQVGLVGLLLLPVAAWVGPRVAIPILAARSAPAPARPVVRPSTVEFPDLADRPLVPTELVPSPPVEDSPGNLSPVVLPPAPRPVLAPTTIWPTVRWETWLKGIYVVIGLLLLARLGGSLWTIRRLVRSSLKVDDPAWLATLRQVQSRLGMTRSVVLARSVEVGVPVVVGWFRPTILLPESSVGGDLNPTVHAEAILLHELAHVQRGDYAWNVLGSLVRAMYWPHPLAWLLGRMLAESRELACDAYCVHELGGPLPYRSALLTMAEGLARPGPALGLAMARRSRLARRVAQIDRGRGASRCLPGRPVRLAIGLVGLALLGALGPVRLTHAEPRLSPVVPPVIVAQDPVPPVEPVPPPVAGRVLRLRVVAAATGEPVPRADVRVWLKRNNQDWRQTDAEGRLDITYATGPDDQRPGVDVWGDGFAMQRHMFGDDPRVPIPAEVTLKLQPGESLGGLVQDEAGHPIEGATVYLWSHNYKRRDPNEMIFDLRASTGPDGRWHTGGAPQTTGELIGFAINHPDFLSDRHLSRGTVEWPKIADLRAGSAVSVMKKGVPIEGRVLNPAGQPVAGALVSSTDYVGSMSNSTRPFAVRTDGDGRFRTGQVLAGEWHLIVQATGFAPAARMVKVGTAVLNEEFRLEAPHQFTARVVDPAGKPIAGAFVVVDSWQGYRCMGVFLYSDADGRVRWDDAPASEFRVDVDHQGYVRLSDQRVRAGSEMTFTLQPALAISGFVREVTTRKVIKQAEVEYGAVDPQTGDVSTWIPKPQYGLVWFNSGWLSARFPVTADAYKIRITSEGYEPFVSRGFRRDETVVAHYDVALTPGQGPGPLATVVRPDGQPLAGARIFRVERQLNIGMETGADQPGQGVTGGDGTFTIPPITKAAVVVILGDDCYAYATVPALTATPRLQARPYGRVEGRFLVGNRPLANRSIHLGGHIQDTSTAFKPLFSGWNTTTDAEGRFVFDKVVPMANLRVGRREPRDVPGGVWSVGTAVQVTDGQTTTITVGGVGRPIIGRVDPPVGWTQPVDFTEKATAKIETDQADTPFPPELFRGVLSLEHQVWSNWSPAWEKTAEGRAYRAATTRVIVNLAPDGSFRIDDVPPGTYRLILRVNDVETGRDHGPFVPIVRTFTVPPMEGGRSDDPLDLGVVPLRVRTQPKVGDPAPPFQVTTVDGRPLNIPGDFAGKFLLLDFGTMWDRQSRLQIARMNDVFARFGANERFRLVSLLMAADQADARAFVVAKGQTWPQVIAGPLDNPIATAYGIEPDNFPAAILIGPEGRIVARDLWSQKIGEAVGQALGVPEQPQPQPQPELIDTAVGDPVAPRTKLKAAPK